MYCVEVTDQYKVYRKDIPKNECSYRTVDDIVERLLRMIADHPVATSIGVFDHFEHTVSLRGNICDEVSNAKIVMCCFGKAIPFIEAIALRPRSIAVVETRSSFVVMFSQAPKKGIDDTFKSWITSLLCY